MIKQFGEDPAVISATRADDMAELGDEEGYGTWKRIARHKRTAKHGIKRGTALTY